MRHYHCYVALNLRTYLKRFLFCKFPPSSFYMLNRWDAVDNVSNHGWIHKMVLRTFRWNLFKLDAFDLSTADWLWFGLLNNNTTTIHRRPSIVTSRVVASTTNRFPKSLFSLIWWRENNPPSETRPFDKRLTTTSMPSFEASVAKDPCYNSCFINS